MTKSLGWWLIGSRWVFLCSVDEPSFLPCCVVDPNGWVKVITFLVRCILWGIKIMVWESHLVSSMVKWVMFFFGYGWTSCVKDWPSSQCFLMWSNSWSLFYCHCHVTFFVQIESISEFCIAACSYLFELESCDLFELEPCDRSMCVSKYWLDRGVWLGYLFWLKLCPKLRHPS